MCHELDVVELITPLPVDDLPAGRRGTVLEVLDGGKAFLVEFYNADEEWVPESDTDYPAVITTVTPDQVRRTWKAPVVEHATAR